jgi:NAD(P) transhydrogenase subunit beta
MITGIAYVISASLFVIGIKLLNSPDTARRGNMVSAVGMLLAIVVTLVSCSGQSLMWVAGAVIIGGLIGGIAAHRVQMTAMPEMVALFNGSGGAASLLVGCAEFVRAPDSPWGILLPISLAIIIGGLTTTGSLIAYGKLSEKISSAPTQLPAQGAINALLLAATVICAILFSLTLASGGGLMEAKMGLMVALVVLSLIIGITAVMPIGGGDMPVVISLLNSYSGLAACAAGFVILNKVLIVAGALVGASGIILTVIMCKAMNRSLTNVLFSGFGSASGGVGGAAVDGEVKPISAEDAYYVLEAARSVLFVPGYGMAVAQAQHVVKELASILEDNGCEVRFAIHPVAGRMPGHMNVLLAEAQVPYEMLVEPDDVNPTMENVDIGIVIGANDVVNPAARTDEASPIYGMPVIDIDRARTVFVLKRSMRSGFAGIQNPLFFCDNTRMLFGDAKESISKLVAEFKDS